MGDDVDFFKVIVCEGINSDDRGSHHCCKADGKHQQVQFHVKTDTISRRGINETQIPNSILNVLLLLQSYNKSQRFQMLQERKRFNYNISGTSYNKTSCTGRIDYKKQALENDRQNLKKIEELQKVNKQLVEETARQFKKLEQDVQRVEQILAEKEQALDQSKQEKQQMQLQLDTVVEEKKLLIEAILQKDIVIKQYETKLQQLLKQNLQKQIEYQAQKVILQQEEQKKEPQVIQIEEKQQTSEIVTINEECQTDPQPVPFKEELRNATARALELEQEVFRLKEELFDATSNVKVVTQQFEAYKVLKQIENLQKQ